jgi:hypothetical protein
VYGRVQTNGEARNRQAIREGTIEGSAILTAECRIADQLAGVLACEPLVGGGIGWSQMARISVRQPISVM